MTLSLGACVVVGVQKINWVALRSPDESGQGGELLLSCYLEFSFTASAPSGVAALEGAFLGAGAWLSLARLFPGVIWQKAAR